MDDRNFQEKYEVNDNKGKSFFRSVGIFFLALFLAVVTVVAINL